MQPLSWYLNRLKLMSVPEMTWRGAQAAQRLRYLRSQVDIPVPDRPGATLRPWPRPEGIEATDYVAAADRIVGGQIPVFASTAVLDGTGAFWSRDPESRVVAPARPGPFIDYRDTQLVGNARNVWELNRQYHLVTLAQAWRLTGDERYRETGARLVASWLAECPYPIGINWVSALELGIRLVNWYLCSRLFGWWQEGAEPVAGWRQSIYWHCKFIERHRSRHSSANNHLLGEMVGLYVAACAWGSWPESARWRRDAQRILLEELPRQIHSDGVGCEQTVDYQMFVLQMLLVAGLVGEESGEPCPAEYWAAVDRMLGFLAAIADVGGHLPAFGDSDDGMFFMLSPDARDTRLADLLAIHELMSRRERTAGTGSATARWIDGGFPRPANWPAGSPERARSFPEGGYYVLGDRLGQPDEVLLVADAAPLGFLSIAAHGHADALSFVLSLGGVPVLVDPGTYCYHSDPVWREYFRGTAAHNTVRVDGLNQSEAVGPFMWSRKAVATMEVFDAAGSPQRFVATHDGYRRLGDPVAHRREIQMDVASATITVTDTLDCAGAHRVERFWHCADDCVAEQTGPGGFRVRAGKCSVEIMAEDAGQAVLHIGSREPISGWVSRRFGTRTPSPTLVMRNDIVGKTRLVTRIRWRFE